MITPRKEFLMVKLTAQSVLPPMDKGMDAKQ